MKHKNEINMCGAIFYYVGFILINPSHRDEKFFRSIFHANIGGGGETEVFNV